MSEKSNASFMRFGDLLKSLSSKSISKTADGKINLSGTILSGKDFDKLYFADIKEMLLKYENTITPEFAPTRQVYEALDALSSPALQNTSVPQAVASFYKKMEQALSTPSNQNKFEETLTSYVNEAKEAPTFMIAEMSANIPLPEGNTLYNDLMPTSNEIMEDYGTKYDGKDILNFAEKGFVEPEAPISMLIYKSLYAQEKTSPDYVEPASYEDLLSFYSPSKHPNRMRELSKSQKITPAFSELHAEMLDNVSVSDRKNYIADLISESKENARTSEDFSQEILGYSNQRIIPDTTLEENISGEFLKKQFLEGKISFARVFEIYKTAPKYFSAVKSILTPNEILEAHSKDEIEDESLMYVPKQTRFEYLQKNHTKFGTMMYLYLHCDGFSVTDLKRLLTEDKIYDSLDSYIDAGSSPERIKELFENYLIDYQAIKNLKNSGILTDKDIQKYHFSISKDNVYQDLSNAKSITIQGSANVVPFTTTGSFFETPKIKPSPKVYAVLGSAEEQDLVNIPIIHHKDDNGNSGFLDNYNVVPLKASNLVALVPRENKSSIYLMPYEEVAFIMKRKRLPNDFSENASIKEVKITEKTNEDLVRTAYQFEEAKPHLDRLGYDERADFSKNLELMLDQYAKIRIKGEN